MMLSTDDFSAFIEEVHGHPSFPWQKRLLAQVAEAGRWPEVLDLPTGAGKTAALDIAVFHLALEADRGNERCAPVRIAFVVDRRLVVDDAFLRAKKLEAALLFPQHPVTARVAERLNTLAGGGRPLIARRLRGGIPREDDWARTPSQPTVLCSTVDQVGSRLLFRGYGVSDSMKPVHAGLIGSDCLILLDEAHLAEPFRQTLDWVSLYRGQGWRETNTAAPWGVALLTATPNPNKKEQGRFSLDDEDRQNPTLKKRLEAPKPAYLVTPTKAKNVQEDGTAASEEETGGGEQDLIRRVTAITEQVERALDHFKDPGYGAPRPVIGVVVNRVARARAVFNQLAKNLGTEQTLAGGIVRRVKLRENLAKKLGAEEMDCLLLIGPARPVDRDRLADELAPIRTGAERTSERPRVLVATQSIEAGVDIDLDALITEAAPLDCLRQRFGRLNRAGREIQPYAVVIATKSDLSARADDPVYGKAIKTAWECLEKAAVKAGKERKVEFGLNNFSVRMQADALAPKADAPIFLPAHLDLLSQTAPIPAADPEVSLYLHGAARQPDSITAIWRADIDPDRNDADIRRLLVLVPPRPGEAIELPLWAVRRWLVGADRRLRELADVATAAPEERQGRDNRRIFRWKGDDERSHWVYPRDLRPGDTILVPARYGGVDEFGWNPGNLEPAKDVARTAAEPFAGRRFSVRVAPGLLGESVTDQVLADALAGTASQRWRDVRTALLDLNLPDGIREDLAALDDAKKMRSIAAYLDLYGMDDEGRPRGVVFVAPFGIKRRSEEEDGSPNATEDDRSGSLAGFPLSLQQHSQDVEEKAERFAKAAGLPPERVQDLKLAGFLHDAGKADPRFQRWLQYGDPLGPDPADGTFVLAKSGRFLPSSARDAAGLPRYWRHEALSVRLAPHVARFADAQDPELVLWLLGSHHGYGRPFFPHEDPEDGKLRRLPPVLGLPSDLPPAPGPQSLAFDWQGLDWPMFFERLKVRYGVWELARTEAILRLADHRASEDRAKENPE